MIKNGNGNALANERRRLVINEWDRHGTDSYRENSFREIAPWWNYLVIYMNIWLSPHIIYRYEPKVPGGPLFIFNKETGKIFVGNHIVYSIINYLKDRGKVSKRALEDYIFTSVGLTSNDSDPLIDPLIKEGIIISEE